MKKMPFRKQKASFSWSSIIIYWADFFKNKKGIQVGLVFTVQLFFF